MLDDLSKHSRDGWNHELPPVESASSRRVLLVEDESIVALDVQERLEELGYAVVGHAATGDEALRLAGQVQPDVILMDIKLRGKMDGIQVAAEIRKVSGVPIVYLTAFADDQTLQRARQTGAHGYLIKPFDSRELHSTLEMALYKYQMETRLRESEARYALAARATNDGIWEWNLAANEVFYSPRWAAMLGLDAAQLSTSPEEWLGRIHPEDRARVEAAIGGHLHGAQPTLECEYRMAHARGDYLWMLCRGLAECDAAGRPVRMAGSQADINTRKHYEDELLHRALHDDLTGLPSRALFMQRLNASRERKPSILFLDLDQFKYINDSFGHSGGDELLVMIARRLQTCLRPGDTVARLGGDEFAILLENAADQMDAVQVAERIQAELGRPFRLHDREVYTNASIGIKYLAAGGQTTEEIMQEADTAMYAAKNKGRGAFEIYRPEMREHSIRTLDQGMDLRRALARQEFVLHYQPIFSLAAGQPVGFEALIRWNHPQRGMVFPDEFIPTAELTRLILPLGDWVLRTACRQALAWNQAAGRPLSVAVNISRLQLGDGKFFQRVDEILREIGLPPHLLELEITESAAMENTGATIALLERFRQAGVRLAMDDFGSGYSSLDSLKRIPVHTLKIARPFVSDLQDGGQAIVAAIITMAHQLGLQVIGEGVETRQQYEALATLACDMVQGFYLGRGVPASEAWKWIAGA